MVCYSKIRYLIVPCCLLVLGGCTTQYTANITRDALAEMRLVNTYHVSRNAEWTLNPSTRLYLAQGAFSNPARDTERYPRLGYAIFDALAHSLSQVFPATQIAAQRLSLLNALAEARMVDAQILVYPSLVFLRDERDSIREISEGSTVHAGTSVAPDKLAFKVVLVDVATGNIVDTAMVTGRGKIFTQETNGPVALLPAAALAYTRQINGNKLTY